MRAQLLHLSGPHRGKTITYPQQRLLLGTSSEATVCFPDGSNVVERHAEIRFVQEGCCFYLTALDGVVFVNRSEITEVILEHDDLLEIGLGGPKMRFRIHAEPGRLCKPVRLMLRDTREVRCESGLVASTHALRRDLITHSTLRLKIGLSLVATTLAFAAAFLGASWASTRGVSKQEAVHREQTEEYERRLAAVHEQLELFRRQQAGHASREEMEALRADLSSRAGVLDTLVAQNAALRRVLDVYSRGVCLVHGVYTFTAVVDGEDVVVSGPDGTPVELEYIGSGFLASAEGHVITNRHVAEPWWNNETVAPLIAQGMSPKFVQLTASFPGKAPQVVDPATIRLSSDEVDVAVFRIEIEDVPVLPLDTRDAAHARGGRVILLGYPTGLNALLARAEPDLVEEVLSSASDAMSLIRALAARDAIAPVITQGALNEVRPRRLVYDAETTSGGSGGPVFGADGTVIGVNFAITRDFDGSNFGVPIRFARKLLAEAASQ